MAAAAAPVDAAPAEAQKALELVLVGGKSVDVDFAGVDSVAELRRRTAAALGAALGSVKLLAGGTILDDPAPLGGLGGVLTVLLSSPGPSWYPANKYMHRGNEVLKITWGFNHNRGHEDHYSSVHYTDGNVHTRKDEGRVRVGGKPNPEMRARLEDIGAEARRLVHELGFITHKTSDYCDQPCRSVSYEAVPPEDPDEWDEVAGGVGTRAFRKPAPTPVTAASDVAPAPTPVTAASAVAAVARQADGMPGVAFRLGSRHREPLFDIPNGSTVQCMAEDGEWIAVLYLDKVGFVKRRNVELEDAVCPPLALLGRVVAAQADGHPGVAFYLGQKTAAPDIDLPNGTEAPCLHVLDDHIVVCWNDQLGFVKRRNVTPVPVDPS